MKDIIRMQQLAGIITEGQAKKMITILKEDLGLTPLQQYLYDYEMEISDEDFADEELDNIKKLNTLEDVYDYYATYRGWLQDKDLQYDLKNLMKTLKRKFKI